MSEDRINGRTPGLLRAERPHQHIYLARRKRDGTHWQVLAMNWARGEAVLFDFKQPEAEPVIEPFDHLDIVDKKEIPGGETEIILPRG